MAGGRIMAVDHGQARIGVALSDETCTIAGRTLVLQVRGDEAAAVAELAELAGREGVAGLVVGLPRNMDGSEGPQAARARAFATRLGEALGLTPRLWDERLTTVHAERLLASAGRTGRARRRVVDAAAAAIILEEFLSSGGGCR